MESSLFFNTNLDSGVNILNMSQGAITYDADL
jgi:hypothetical protein